ncbi:hypothetical protein G6F68_020639 [Rhizopus microsporus]|nr:hypothetical protein G6F68_020639 [Rhizopus microsporus]
MLDLMVLRPVENRAGAFDDRGEHGAHLWGAYATTARGQASGQWDLYLLDYRRDGARFAAGSGTERRQTLGARWAVNWGPPRVTSTSAHGRWPPIRVGAGRTCRCSPGWA